MPLDTIQAIMTRYSCRSFLDKAPRDEDLRIIAEAGVAAPSAMNRQNWRVIAVKDRALIADMEAEGMKKLSASVDRSFFERIMFRGGKLFYNAPCMIVIPIAKSNGCELLDCGIVAENIALAATSLGIDNLICGLTSWAFGGEKDAEFKRRLGFPEGCEIGTSVLLGYAERPGGRPHEPDFGKISFIG